MLVRTSTLEGTRTFGTSLTMRYGNSQAVPSNGAPNVTDTGSNPANAPSENKFPPKIAPHRFVDRGREPATISSLLASALRRPDLRYQFERYQFVLHWQDIVGEELAKVTKPECLKQERLVIRVSSSAWAQEISFRKKFILNRLMPYLKKEEVVRDIYLLVGREEKRR